MPWSSNFAGLSTQTRMAPPRPWHAICTKCSNPKKSLASQAQITLNPNPMLDGKMWTSMQVMRLQRVRSCLLREDKTMMCLHFILHP